jgi:hypothetical protein
VIAYCAAVMRMGGAEDGMVVAPHLSPMDVQMMCAGARGAPRGARSIRHADHAVAEALRLHLADVASPLAFVLLLADHLAALLFERLAVVS